MISTKNRPPHFTTKSLTQALVSVVILALSALPLRAVTDYTIYPIPQQKTLTEGTATLSGKVTLVADADIDQPTRARAEEVLTAAGCSFAWADKVPSSGKVVKLSIDASLTANGRFDHHQISLTSPSRLTVTGQNTDAVFFGLASVEQMLEQTGGKAMPCVEIDDWADQQMRGIVEGYYGYPYTVEVRKDLMRWGRRYKMNTFIYGPKGDPYHLGYWRRDYPVSIPQEEAAVGMITQDDLRELAAVSVETKVAFIWAAHPAFSDPIDLSTERGTRTGADELMTKFSHLYELGIRQFGIFLDDISVGNGVRDCKNHALLLRMVQDALKEKYNRPDAQPADTVRPLQFVPTPYALNFASAQDLTTYFAAISTVQPEINVYFTGSGVWSNISESDYVKMKGYVGRPVTMWWNFPCNDNNDRNIYLMDVDSYYRTDASLRSSLGVVCNPMAQGEASKVTLFGVMDYLWNVKAFASKTNWKHAFDAVCFTDSSMAAAFREFAPYAMQNEPQELGTLIDKWKKTPSAVNLTNLLGKLQAIRLSCEKLKTLEQSDRVDDRLLFADIQQWIDKLHDMCALAIDYMDVAMIADEEEQLTQCVSLAARYKELGKSKLYTVVQKEGAGFSTNTSTGIVTPSDKYLRPFVEWLKTNAVDIPERSILAKITSCALASSGIYSGSAKSLYDGDYSTYLWTNSNQKVDDCYTFTLKEKTPVYNVRVVLMEGDRPNEGVVEISIDKTQWTTVGTVKSSALTQIQGYDAYYKDVPVSGKEAKYVRFRLSGANTSKWFKMVELEVTNSIPARDHAGNAVPALYDHDLSTSFSPILSPVTYYFAQSGTAPKQAIVYQDASIFQGVDESRLPKACISDDGKVWKDTVLLDRGVNRIDLSTLEGRPYAMKIISSMLRKPVLYEITESTEAYNEIVPLTAEKPTEVSGCFDLQGRKIDNDENLQTQLPAGTICITDGRKILIN